MAQDWLQIIEYDLQQLRRTFSDYQSLYAKTDPLYQQWSPVLNEKQAQVGLIGFPLDLEPTDNIVSRVEDIKLKAASFASLWTRTSSGVRWALQTRRQFESLLAEFKKWNGKLKEIGLACSMEQLKVTRANEGRSAAVVDELSKIQQSEEDENLGLDTAASLKRLTLISNKNVEDFELQGYDLAPESEQHDSSLLIAQLKPPSSTASHPVIIEHKEYGDLNESHNRTAMHQLASLLSQSRNSDLKTLPFRGIVTPAATQSIERQACTFIFDFPQKGSRSTVLSLYEAFSSRNVKRAVPLATRFKIAESLTRSVWYLHTVGWLHKNIRSSNIVFLSSEQNSTEFSSPFLVGFEYARLESEVTNYSGSDDDRLKNLYRHPDRQGSPTTRFARLHDLYALGLVLLEIGLWRPLGSLLEDDSARNEKEFVNGKRPVLNPKRILELFQQTALEELSLWMGESYRDAVVACLEAESGYAKHSATVYGDIVQKVGMDALLQPEMGGSINTP
jgi:hypothetical protein